MAFRPITDEEGSKGGARSILTFAVVAAVLTVLLVRPLHSVASLVAPDTQCTNQYVTAGGSF